VVVQCNISSADAGFFEGFIVAAEIILCLEFVGLTVLLHLLCMLQMRGFLRINLLA